MVIKDKAKLRIKEMAFKVQELRSCKAIYLQVGEAGMVIEEDVAEEIEQVIIDNEAFKTEYV
jgi:hypothetical protein